MGLFLIILLVAILFGIYLLEKNWTGAVIFLTFGLGYQVLSYYHHFLGGMEARGHTGPINEELMFATIIIGTLATLAGFSASGFYKCRARLGYENVSRLFVFFMFGCGLAVTCTILAITLPLSFEMPVRPTSS